METKRSVWVSELHHLIAAPLAAVIDADFAAARKFVQYISEFGFDEPCPDDPPGGPGQPGERGGGGERSRGFIGDLRMVSFTVDQHDSDGRVRTRMVRIPALSLVPLPLLQVKEAEFHFAVRVIEGNVRDADELKQVLGGDDCDDEEILGDDAPVSWRAMLVPDAGKGERDGPACREAIGANLKVRLAVAQSDIPAGITRLLALMNESAHIVSGSIHLSRRRIELAVGRPETLRITVTSIHGEPVVCDVKAQFPKDGGLVITGNGQHWPAGGTIATTEDGTITLGIALDPAASFQSGEQIVLRFSAVVDGLELSESLYVLVQ